MRLNANVIDFRIHGTQSPNGLGNKTQECRNVFFVGVYVTVGRQVGVVTVQPNERSNNINVFCE